MGDDARNELEAIETHSICCDGGGRMEIIKFTTREAAENHWKNINWYWTCCLARRTEDGTWEIERVYKPWPSYITSMFGITYNDTLLNAMRENCLLGRVKNLGVEKPTLLFK